MTRPKFLPLLAAILLVACVGQAQTPALESRSRVSETSPVEGESIRATYLANEGFLVEVAGTRILVDALFGEGIAGYPAVSASRRESLEAGQGPFDGVTLVLATHYHGDHFKADAVEAFLLSSPEAEFVSTPQAVAELSDAIERHPTLATRIHSVLPGSGKVVERVVGDIHLQTLNLHHGPGSTQNLGFIVKVGATSFIHFGDTEAKMPDFEPYLSKLADHDLGLLPFWFLSSEWRAEMIATDIRPRSIIVAHLPQPAASSLYFGRWGSYDNLVSIIRANFPGAELPTQEGIEYTFGSWKTSD